jgi:hypothetical protein
VLDLALPPGTDVGALAVRFEGRVSLACPFDTDPSRLNEVTFDARNPLEPLIEWDCWPGWEPRPSVGADRTQPAR